MTGATDNSALD